LTEIVNFCLHQIREFVKTSFFSGNNREVFTNSPGASVVSWNNSNDGSKNRLKSRFSVERNVFPGFYWFRDFYHDIYDYGYELLRGITKNPSWLIMRKLGRFGAVRSLIHRFKSRSTPIAHFVSESAFPDTSSESVVQSLVKDGIYLGLNLPPEMLEDIIAYTKQYPCYGDRKAEFGFHYTRKREAQQWYNRSFVTGHYFNNLENCPAIQKLTCDPLLLSIAADYLGCDPVLIGSQISMIIASSSSSFI
jgi:hypothetical protein